MKDKKRIIVYGLGKKYQQSKRYLENKYEIIGYSDSRYLNTDGYIEPKDICKYNYDYVCVTSVKYFVEIKEKLVRLLGSEKEKNIISLYDALGDFRNSEIRDQWVIAHLKDIPAGKILVDAGAGEQKYKPYCSHLKYIAQDFGEYIPNEVKNGIQSDSWDYSGLNIKCDIINMPLKQESVDVILCTEVFEHIKNPMLALEEFVRVLKTGGSLILTAPFCCLTHMAPYFYYNGFSEYWYKEHLESYGFRIIELTRNGDYFKYLSQELFRLEEMAERYCHYRLKNEELETVVRCMELMAKLSSINTNSNETLCFGNMVVAEKIKGEYK